MDDDRAIVGTLGTIIGILIFVILLFLGTLCYGFHKKREEKANPNGRIIRLLNGPEINRLPLIYQPHV